MIVITFDEVVPSSIGFQKNMKTVEFDRFPAKKL